MTYDYLIVGAGFAGSVLAERLARVDKKRVLIVDTRPHIGGTAYDYHDAAGLLVHRYGPHVFHTSSSEVVDYLSQFTSWRPYEHRVQARVDGRLVSIPINLDTASQRELYLKVFRDLAQKHLGLDPAELELTLSEHAPLRATRDDRNLADTFQGMPLEGYTRMFERMLDQPGINVMLQTDYRDIVSIVPWERMIYTGPIDAFFDFRFGRLPWRGMTFRHETHAREVFQPAATVSYANESLPYTRITEFKYLTGQRHDHTSIVYEYPVEEGGEPCYPVPRPEHAERYARYAELADATPYVHFIGRLASYRYLSMDQVVAQALALFERLAGARYESTNSWMRAHFDTAARARDASVVRSSPRTVRGSERTTV